MSLNIDYENGIIGTKPDRARDLPLFAPVVDPERPTPIRATTSLAAHRTAGGKAQTKKAAILTMIRVAGISGATRKELAESCSYLRDTVNARCRELLDANLVHETGAERHGEHLIFAGPTPMTKP